MVQEITECMHGGVILAPTALPMLTLHSFTDFLAILFKILIFNVIWHGFVVQEGRQ